MLFFFPPQMKVEIQTDEVIGIMQVFVFTFAFLQ